MDALTKTGVIEFSTTWLLFEFCKKIVAGDMTAWLFLDVLAKTGVAEFLTTWLLFRFCKKMTGEDKTTWLSRKYNYS